MLEFKGVQKAYRNKRCLQIGLDDINLSFRDSEFVVLLGPSGSGKTTFLNIASGLDSYDSGDILIDGVSTKKYRIKSWDKYRNHKTGFIFQNHNLIDHQTALGNVELALSLSGFNSIKRNRLAKYALKQVGLEKDIYRRLPNELSNEQHQRVAVARAIVNNPKVILADEPTGILDTKNGKRIMDLLKKVGENKLVIVATHDETIAKKYATRIIKISDGKITQDTDPFDSTNVKPMKTKDKTRTSLALLAAFRLSLASLWHKKGRALITIFAGAIGIIGISFIIALANGMNNYVHEVEQTTLSQYPLQINQSKPSLSSTTDKANENTFSGKIAESTSELNKETPEGRVALKGVIAPLLSSNGQPKNKDEKPQNNDIAALKKYLDANPDNFNDAVAALEYNYNTSPVIYADNSNGIYEVYPNPIFGSLGSNSGATSANSKASASSSFSFNDAFQVFFPLPKEKSIYEDDYSIVAGHWPKNSNEAVLVLHQDGTIDDSLLYTLGMRNFEQDVSPVLEKLSNGEAVTFPGQDETFAYEDFLKIKFKVINPADAYAYNEQYKIWEDKSYDVNYMSNIVKNAEDLSIVGIVLPPQGSKNAMTLTSGINYSYDLNLKNLDRVAQSGVVKAQLANPEVDVLSGQTFAALADSSRIFDKFDFSNIININIDKLRESIKINPEVLDPNNSKSKIREFKFSKEEIVSTILSAIDDEELKEAVAGIIEMYQECETAAAAGDTTCADIAALLAEIGAEEAYELVTTKAVEGYVGYATQYWREKGTTEGMLTPEEYFMKDGQKIIEDAYKELIGILLTPEEQAKIVRAATRVTESLFNYFYQEVEAVLSSYIDWLLDDSAGRFIEFYPEKLAEVVKINITEKDIIEMYNTITGISGRTFKGNLADFGYVDLNEPISVTIYPKDFNSKAKITAIINQYNENQKAAGSPEKTIAYTDYVDTLVKILTSSITAIGIILIALIAGSLVVSSLLIGIIIFISVLRRKHEIGILRSLGARKRDIRRVFNAESILIGLFAGVFGIIVAGLLCIPINNAVRNSFGLEYNIAILPGWAVLLMIAVSIVLTFIAGFIPARLAGRRKPVDAIRDC